MRSGAARSPRVEDLPCASPRPTALQRECAAMQGADYVPLRRVAGPGRIVDEYAVRFVYSGEGLDRAPVAAGDRVELQRLRVLELVAERVVLETCIETWTVLDSPARR